MKILVISAHYPPHHLGGYELRIKDIMDGLFKKGHDIRILTTISTSRNLKTTKNSRYKILRKLHHRKNAKFFPNEILFDLLDTKCLHNQINSYNPDVVYLGHIYNLSKALLPYLAKQNIPLILDEGGASLKGAWTEHGRWFRFTGDYQSKHKILNSIKPFVIKLIISLSKNRIKEKWCWPNNFHVIFNNERNYKKTIALGMPIKKASVIHSGININKFPFNSREVLSPPIKIIYPARIEPLKGQLDAVQLIAHLKRNNVKSQLLLVGKNYSNEYFDEISREISHQEISDLVTFMPMVNQEKLVSLYHQYDILFFPTYHQMGFSRTPLEAMACGCVVISYGNEGSNEVVINANNGYIFQARYFEDLVEIITKLIDSPKLYIKLLKNARNEIMDHYDLQKYITHIEEFLFSLL